MSPHDVDVDHNTHRVAKSAEALNDVLGYWNISVVDARMKPDAIHGLPPGCYNRVSTRPTEPSD